MDQIVIAEIALIWVAEWAHFQSSQNPRFEHICSRNLDPAPRYLASRRTQKLLCLLYFVDLAFVIFNHLRLTVQAYL